jgi:probable F420-dependent oxidoreductase
MRPPKAERAIATIEELGFGTIWYPEAVGSNESLTQAAMFLNWSERITVASAIVNIWGRDAIATANAARLLTGAFPGRYLLGVGASNEVSVPARGHTFSRPLTRMREYLDAMDEAPYMPPEPEEPVRRFLAALGPKMLALAAERGIGAHTYFVPVEHTAFARETMGPGALLAVEQAVMLTDDRTEARRVAQKHLGFYLARKFYRRNLARFGWAESEMEGTGSDPLFDAIVAWGDIDAVRARVQAHFEAGADHVCIQPLGADPSDLQLEQLQRLAPALIES